MNPMMACSQTPTTRQYFGPIQSERNAPNKAPYKSSESCVGETWDKPKDPCFNGKVFRKEENLQGNKTG